MLGLMQFEEAMRNATRMAHGLQIYGPETEGDRLLAKALQDVLGNLDQAMRAFNRYPNAPEKHNRLGYAINGIRTAWFIALAKDEPDKLMANRIQTLRDQIVRAQRIDSDWW